MLRPVSIVLLNLFSSSDNTLKIMLFFSSNSGYPSFELSITVSESVERNLPSIPSSLPCLAARLINLLNTYPLPSFDGIIPSEIINVADLIWSVTILIETSHLYSFLYSLFASSQTLSLNALIVSTSKIESTS
jgi:hypothetical protein